VIGGRGLAFFFIILLLGTGSLLGQSYEDVYRSVFGKPVQNKYRLMKIGLVIDDEVRGEVDAIVPTLGSNIRLKTVTFLPFLKAVLISEKYRAIEATLAGVGEITIANLKDLEFGVVFKRKGPVLVLTTPVAARHSQTIYVTSPPPAMAYEAALRPQGLSSFLNWNANGTYVAATSGLSARSTYSVDWENVSFFDGLVLRTEGDFIESTTVPFLLKSARIEKEDLSSQLTYQIGDVLYPLSNHQTFSRLLGVGVTKGFFPNIDRGGHPLNHTRLQLEKPGKVQVSVNGRPVKSYQLAPGRYLFRRFPWAGGYNRVVLDILYEDGTTDHSSFVFIADHRLVFDQGEEYTVNVGFPVHYINRQRLSQSNPSASLFYRRNLGSNVSLGGLYQGSQHQLIGGVEAFIGLPMGLFGGDFVYTYHANGFEGAGGDLGLKSYIGYIPGEGIGLQRWDMRLEYRSPDFVRLGESSPQSQNRLRFIADFEFGMGRDISAQLNGFYGIPQGNGGSEYGMTTGFFSRLPFMDLRVAARLSRSAAGDSEWFLSSQVVLPLGDRSRRLVVSRPFGSDQTQVNVNLRTSLFDQFRPTPHQQ